MKTKDTIFTNTAYAVTLALLLGGIVRLESEPQSLVALYAIAIAVAFLAARPLCALGRWAAENSHRTLLTRS